MNKLFLIIILGFVTLYAQDKDSAAVNWIDANAITIENTNQDTPMEILKQKENGLFKDIRVFGFGEATHNGKEFFDLKAKFFRYLAENHGVRLFMIEDCYGCNTLIDDYIAGGDVKSKYIATRTGYGLWRTEEMEKLIQWMRIFNQGRPENDRIKFIGIDNKFGNYTSDIVNAFVYRNKIDTGEGFSAFLDSCAVISSYNTKRDKKLKSYISRLTEAQKMLKSNFKPTNVSQEKELDTALHAIIVLQQSLEFSYSPDFNGRDKAMADNVLWGLQHYGPQSKAFVWAHNYHISKDNSRYTRLGLNLKNTLGDSYYAMGFILGSGNIYQMSFDRKYGKLNTIDKPFKGNYAEVFNKAKAPVFFFDIKLASADAAMKKFIESNKTVIDAGANGYNPKFKGGKENLARNYDGIIYTKYVSLPNYIKGSVPDALIIKQ